MTTSTILSDNGVSSGSSGLKTSGGNDGTLVLQTTTSGGTATTALTIDTSQNVGIGTSSITREFANYNQINLNGSSGATLQLQSGGSQRANIIADVNNMYIAATNVAYGLVFGVGGSTGTGTERMRIDASGNLLVGKTSTDDTVTGIKFGAVSEGNVITAGSGFAWGFMVNRQADNGDAIRFRRTNSNVGSISVTTTATAYNTSSDYRLKENIAPMTGALAKVAALKPCTYTWKSDGSDGEGFIAHELAEVVPNAVTGVKDAVETYTDEEGNEQTRPVYQGIDTSFLVATLTAAIQELKAELDEVKAQLKGEQA